MYLSKRAILLSVFLLLPFVKADALFGIETNKAQKNIIARLEENVSAGDYDAAEELGREFLIKYPSASKKRLKQVYMLLGEAYLAEGQPDKAMLIYNEAAEFLPKDTDMLLSLGDIYLEGNLTDNAKSIYGKVLKLDKDNKLALLGLAKAYFEEGFFSKASFYFKQYEDSGAKEPKDFLYYYAVSEYLSNNNDGALQIAFRSLIFKPDADGYLLIAKIYKNKKDLDNAVNYLDKALEKDSSRKDIYMIKMLWLAFNTKTCAEGLKMAEEILKQDSKDKLALFAKYIALFKQGSFEKANRQLEKITAQEGDGFIDRIAQKIYGYTN